MKLIELGKSVKIISGFAFKSESFTDNGIPVIKISNIGLGDMRIEESNTQYVEGDYLDKLDEKFKVSFGDVLISLTGSHITQPNSVVGRVSLYKESYISLLNQRAGKVINIDKKVFDKRFLFYILNSASVRTTIALMAHGAASQANVSPKDVERIKLLVPTVENQKKIAAILSAYDDLIENNKKRIQILENIAEELYKEWFVRFRFPNWENTEFEKGLPSSWDRTQLKYLCCEVKQSIKKEDLNADTKYLGLEHLSRKDIAIYDYSSADTVDSNKLKFKKFDILFAKIRPYLHKVCLAHFDGICSSDTIVLRAKDPIFLPYILFTVFSETFIDLADVSSNGTKMPRANWNFLQKVVLSIPPNELMEKFYKICMPIFIEIETLLNQIEILNQQKDSLLPRLISGKLSVENLDIQFPPSMQEL
ncbi:restriction endonuclease subunit S [Acinetobacter bereziniae]|uniref:restriction endonuclease subunit S n=1 Tax=Acinetobacter bereziniae TaxID=106648 RepID=UPI003AF84C7C